MRILFCVIIFYSNLSFCAQSDQSMSSTLANVLRVGGSIVAGVAAGLYYHFRHPVKVPVEDGVLYWHEQEKITLAKLYKGLIATDNDLMELNPDEVSFSCRDNLYLCVNTKYFINLYKLQKKNIMSYAYLHRIPKSHVYRFPQKLVMDGCVVPYTPDEMLTRLQEQQKDVESWRLEKRAKLEADKRRVKNKHALTTLGCAAVAGLGSFVLFSHLAKK